MTQQQSLNKVRVWDLPTRAFHWLLAAAALGSFVSVKIGGNAMIWHGRFGYAVLTLLIFRVIWGLVGPVHARFSQFLKGPAAILAELKGQNKISVGHNPLGALSVVALILLFASQSLLGLLTSDDIFYDGPMVKYVSSTTVELAGWAHRNAEWFLVGMVALHVLAVIVHRVVKKHDLIGPMFTGDQAIPADMAVQPSRDDMQTRLTALLILALSAGAVAVIAYA